MTDKQNRSAFSPTYVLHFSNGFFLEFSISNSKDFVNNENLRIKMSGDSKAQADLHAGRIALDWSVNIALAAGEIDNLVKLSGDFGFIHSQNSTIHVYIFAPCHLGMETCAYFKQGSDSSTCMDRTDRRASHF